MDYNKLLKIFLAFILGYMLPGMMRNICGGRLVEGVSSQCGYGKIRHNLVDCRPCYTGTFNSKNDIVGGKCIGCSAGTYQDKTGQSSCKDCPNGSYASAEGSSQCKSCSDYRKSSTSKGPFTKSIPRSTTVEDCRCEANHYYDEQKFICSSCHDFIDGSVTENDTYGGGKGEEGNRVCKCPVGTYYDETNSSCTKCLKGTYNSTIGLDTQCTNCPAGQFSDSNGANICKKCPEGHVSNEGSSSCTMCEPGKGPNSSQAQCEDCKIGYFSNESTGGSCEKCPSGHVSNKGSSSCTMCEPGKGPNSSQTMCEDCKIGYFSNESTGGSCVTFDSGGCPVSRRFGGSQTGLKDCPEQCKDTRLNFTDTPINKKQSLRYENNIPFIKKIIPGVDLKGHNPNTVYVECGSKYDCTPGGFGYNCDNGTCTADGTKNYDELQKIFYDSDISKSGYKSYGNWTTISKRSCMDFPMYADISYYDKSKLQ
jgi:hypothetical protein